MHPGEKPENNPQAFTAREVLSNLAPFVLDGQPAVTRY